jgi:hypothetical protein
VPRAREGEPVQPGLGRAVGASDAELSGDLAQRSAITGRHICWRQGLLLRNSVLNALSWRQRGRSSDDDTFCAVESGGNELYPSPV